MGGRQEGKINIRTNKRTYHHRMTLEGARDAFSFFLSFPPSPLSPSPPLSLFHGDSKQKTNLGPEEQRKAK